ncbi:MAG: hypothetical protein DRR04_05395 [Gammaproteobacteria bacterium]|nr:MAG: hypothetical protein DRQ97_06810 [Gammaproteobacteria bacterium]RLA60563.1 MAG: hypothetical protein DRR04_05395 [Gammaproteobacteria bacterium]
MNSLSVSEPVRTKKELLSAYELVEDILSKSERSRNCDNWLIFKFLQRSGQDIRVEKHNMGFSIVHRMPFDNFGKQPSRETITRVRRMIQMSEGRFLPTDIDVFDRRSSRSKSFKHFFKRGVA